jgi:hypothetical protein
LLPQKNAHKITDRQTHPKIKSNQTQKQIHENCYKIKISYHTSFCFLAPPIHSNPQITQSLASNSQSTHKISSTKGKHNLIGEKGNGALCSLMGA